MNNVTLFIKTIVVSLAFTASVQAAELVKVEATNNLAFTDTLNLDLAKSVKQLKQVTLNVKNSASSMLITKQHKVTSTTITESVLVAAAE